MKLTVFVLFCIVQSITGRVFNVSDLIHPGNDRVIGGVDAEDGAAPFQCSLQSNKWHFCGCAIISAEWIVTASHCVDGEDPRTLEVMVGSNDKEKDGTYYKIDKYIKHEKYNGGYPYDIAVVRVKGSIKLTKKVQPIKISSEEVPEGSVLQLTGWGQAAGGASPQWLQIINLNAVQTERCRKIYEGENIHDSHICTFTKAGEGACVGDSGGPLVFGDKLVGLVNFGVPCAVGYPDVYAKVSYLYDWIKLKAQD